MPRIARPNTLNALSIMPNVPSIGQPTLFFGKIGRIASEKKLYSNGLNKNVHLCGLETCPLKKADLRSLDLDFVIDRLFMKLFRTNNMDTVRQCQQVLNFDLPSVTVVNRAAKIDSQLTANNLQ